MTNAGTAERRNGVSLKERATKATAGLLVATLALLALPHIAEARISIRPHLPYDNFFFHGNYVAQPFDPTADFTLEVWKCANGAPPTFVALSDPLIVCDQGGQTRGELVYSVDVPGGTCVDHGRSCYYRNTAVSSATPGVRFFKVQYAHLGRGNRVWLDSYGDLSAATQATMLLLIKIDGHARASRVSTFTPSANGGWFTP